jgi:hypothetical protein
LTSVNASQPTGRGTPNKQAYRLRLLLLLLPLLRHLQPVAVSERVGRRDKGEIVAVVGCCSYDFEHDARPPTSKRTGSGCCYCYSRSSGTCTCRRPLVDVNSSHLPARPEFGFGDFSGEDEVAVELEQGRVGLEDELGEGRPTSKRTGSGCCYCYSRSSGTCTCRRPLVEFGFGDFSGEDEVAVELEQGRVGLEDEFAEAKGGSRILGGQARPRRRRRGRTGARQGQIGRDGRPQDSVISPVRTRSRWSWSKEGSAWRTSLRRRKVVA